MKISGIGEILIIIGVACLSFALGWSIHDWQKGVDSERVYDIHHDDHHDEDGHHHE